MSTKCVNTPHPCWTVIMQPCRDALIMHIERASFQALWYSAVKVTKTIPRADGHDLHTVNGKVGGILDCFFMSQDWLKSRWGNPKRKITIKNTQSLRILMASGLRLTYVSKLDMHSVTLKVRDIQVWQPSMALALVSLAGENTPKLWW